MTREQIATFREALGENAVLFHTLDGSRVAASIIGIVSGGVLHGFFGGPHPDYVRLGSYKLLLHFMAEWSAGHGLNQVNIGGGRGGRDADSLYVFKTGFSHNRMPFYVGRLVVNAEAYDALSAAAGAHGTEFFPAYRFAK
jgi:lipid II:glycine glycyltransferase (peptidoglycan interpeptide bridge formation enzyme)